MLTDSRQAELQRANAWRHVSIFQESARSPVHLAPEHVFCALDVFIAVIFAVKACVTVLYWFNPRPHINLPIREESVSYETGSNPKHTMHISYA